MSDPKKTQSRAFTAEDFAEAGAEVQVTDNSRSNPNQDRAEFYAKVGQTFVNPETDEIEFISLPQALFIDTMKKNKVSGEGQFQEMLLKGNDLLTQLIMFAQANLEPGEYRDLKLTVRLYRRKRSQEAKHIPIAFKF